MALAGKALALPTKRPTWGRRDCHSFLVRVAASLLVCTRNSSRIASPGHLPADDLGTPSPRRCQCPCTDSAVPLSILLASTVGPSLDKLHWATFTHERCWVSPPRWLPPPVYLPFLRLTIPQPRAIQLYGDISALHQALRPQLEPQPRSPSPWPLRLASTASCLSPFCRGTHLLRLPAVSRLPNHA